VTTASPTPPSSRFNFVGPIVVAAFIAIAAYVVIVMPLQGARVAREMAEADVTSNSLMQLARVLELYREDRNHFPVANNAPITRELVYVWALSPKWTPPRSPIAPNEPYRLTVTGSGAKATYTIVAPGVFNPDALARFPTVSGNPCAQTCSRLVWRNDRVVAL
jgi:hypothetical protein